MSNAEASTDNGTDKKRKRKNKYPKPTILEISKITETNIVEDGKKYNRKFKAHAQYILDQYASGNIKIKVEGTNPPVWIDVNISQELADSVKEIVAKDDNPYPHNKISDKLGTTAPK